MEWIRPNLCRIPVPLPDNPLKELNSYLIKGEDRSLLIDTGFRLPECKAALEKGLAEAGADRDRLDVLLTHIHTDHTGNSVDMVSEGGTIYIGAGDFDELHWEYEKVFWEQTDRRFYEEGFPPEEAEILLKTNPARTLGPTLDLPIYKPLYDGDKLTVGEYTLEVLAVPGHTPGQICLWLESEGILFTADHVLFDITPNICMWPNLENALGHYLESLRRVREYPVKLALPGHRHSADLKERIDQLLQHHRDRVAETLSIVTAYPGMTAYDITARMTWDIRAKSWADFPLNQKWFAVGEALAHLELLLNEGTIRKGKREDGFNGYWRVK